MLKFFNNKSILITGATGSFGKNFVNYLLNYSKSKKIIIFSRDEYKQFKLKQLYQNHKNFKKLRFFIGDIRDLKRLEIAFSGVDFVIHAAALKHVDIAEYNPIEFINTNIIGTQNVILASISQKVRKVIVLSTDKAVNPINLYGSTKLSSDKLAIAANNYALKKNTIFSVVRYGNVVNSRGSVIPKFLELTNLNKKTLPVTDVRMTRFVISIKDAIEFVIQSLSIMKGAEIFLPKCKTIKIIDLVSSFNKKPIFIGKRPGEKLHESLISEDDSSDLYEFKNFYIQKLNEKNSPKKIKLGTLLGEKIKNFNYSSNDKAFLKINKIKILINDLLR